ncbi:MAG: EamA family transporter [Pseudomonadota bacterium]
MNSAFLYIVTVMIWGSTFFAVEFQLGVVAPEVSLVYRFVAASLILFGFCKCTGRELKFALRQHLWFIALGSLLFGINYVLAYRSQVYTTSAMTAIAFSTMLWMNIINARLFFGVRASRSVIVGAVLGVVGIATLFAPEVREFSLEDTAVIGVLLAMTSAFVASLGNMASQRAQKVNLPVVQSNAWGMLYGGALSALYAAISGYEFAFELSPSYVVSLAYLAVFGSIFAFGAYLTLLGRIGAHRAGYAMVMFPLIALLLSAAFEGLVIDRYTIIGAALVLGGNLLVLLDGSRRAGALRREARVEKKGQGNLGSAAAALAPAQAVRRPFEG